MLVENQVSDNRRIVFVDNVIDDYGTSPDSTSAAQLSENYQFSVLFATESTGETSTIEYSPSIWHNGKRFGICGVDTSAVNISEVTTLNINNENNVITFESTNIVTDIYVSEYSYSEPTSTIKIYNSSNKKSIHIGLKSGASTVFDGSPILQITNPIDDLDIYRDNCAEYIIQYNGDLSADGTIQFKYNNNDACYTNIDIEAYKWPQLREVSINQNSPVMDQTIIKDTFSIEFNDHEGYLDNVTSNIYKVKLYSGQRQLLKEEDITLTNNNSFIVNNPNIIDSLLDGEENIIVIALKNDNGEYDTLYETIIKVIKVEISPSQQIFNLQDYVNSSLILSSNIVYGDNENTSWTINADWNSYQYVTGTQMSDVIDINNQNVEYKPDGGLSPDNTYIYAYCTGSNLSISPKPVITNVDEMKNYITSSASTFNYGVAKIPLVVNNSNYYGLITFNNADNNTDKVILNINSSYSINSLYAYSTTKTIIRPLSYNNTYWRLKPESVIGDSENNIDINKIKIYSYNGTNITNSYVYYTGMGGDSTIHLFNSYNFNTYVTDDDNIKVRYKLTCDIDPLSIPVYIEVPYSYMNINTSAVASAFLYRANKDLSGDNALYNQGISTGISANTDNINMHYETSTMSSSAYTWHVAIPSTLELIPGGADNIDPNVIYQTSINLSGISGIKYDIWDVVSAPTGACTVYFKK